MSCLSFNTLRESNIKRLGNSAYGLCESEWSLSDWHLATSGELGEFANLLKKVIRGDFTIDEKREDLGKELADVQCYLDILAYKLGVDLGEVTKNKFNEISKRIGSNVYIGEPESVKDSEELKVGDDLYLNGKGGYNINSMEKSMETFSNVFLEAIPINPSARRIKVAGSGTDDIVIEVIVPP